MTEEKLIKCGDTVHCAKCGHHIDSELENEKPVACHTLNDLGRCDFYMEAKQASKKSFTDQKKTLNQ